jgi:hypothetical protein
LADGALLGFVFDQIAAFANRPTERHHAAQMPLAGFLVALNVADALSRTVALGFGDGGHDDEHQLGNTVARHVGIPSVSRYRLSSVA